MEAPSQSMPTASALRIDETSGRQRALSHKDYLSTLQRPSAAEVQRISHIQLQRESKIRVKYEATAEEHDAATTIQKAYRGHRERRQLDGLNLDPSSRWIGIIKEWRYRLATAPHRNPASPTLDGRTRATSDVAKENWTRVTLIAERAGASERIPSNDSRPQTPDCPSTTPAKDSMLMDLRYFLEMVDQKHRYGANLQIYHLEWQRSKTDQTFFYWLDHGPGLNLSLPYCDRAKLDRERVRYLTREERRDYLVAVDAQGRLCWAKNNKLITTSAEDYKDSMHGIVPKTDTTSPAFNDASVQARLEEEERFTAALRATRSSTPSSPTPSDQPTLEENLAHQTLTTDATPHKASHAPVSPATILNHLLRATVRPNTWIYVADTLGRLYIGIKSSGAFQHASFLAGARIASAGSLTVTEGRLLFLSPLSGHYRPTTRSFRAFVDGLKAQGVDLKGLKVSSAYGVLLGMEYYGKTKAGLRKVTHRGEKERRTREEEVADLAVELGVDETATEGVERHWREEHHRKGLAGLMDDLNLRRRSRDRLK